VLAHQVAVESKWVVSEAVEAMEFPELASQFGVSGVPHTSINFGAGEIIGASPEAYLIEQVRLALNN
jgi:hypothetical protein